MDSGKKAQFTVKPRILSGNDKMRFFLKTYGCPRSFVPKLCAGAPVYRVLKNRK